MADQTAERSLLEGLYDKLYEVISYRPSGSTSPITPATTKVYMGKQLVLDPVDFADLDKLNANNVKAPEAGLDNLQKLRRFSEMCDAIPDKDEIDWRVTGRKLSESYFAIANAANSLIGRNEAGDTRYKKAKAELSDDFTDKYNQAATDYETALSAYRSANLDLDMNDPKDQRKWQAQAPALKGAIDRAWNKWIAGGKDEYERARNEMASSINDGVSAAISDAKAMALSGGLQPVDDTGVAEQLWYPVFANPQRWMTPGFKGVTFKLDSKTVSKETSSQAQSYGGGANGMYGLRTFGGSASHSTESEHSHSKATAFTLTAELIQVQLTRRWYNPLLFTLSNWYVNGYNAGAISDDVIPWVPTSLILAKNLKATADFSDEELNTLKNKTDAGISVGWGPFSVSGNYSYAKSESKFTGKYANGSLEFAGLQLLGVVCARTPHCPPVNPPA